MIYLQKLLKSVDAIAGKLLTSLLTISPTAQVSFSPKRILFIRPGGIGDAVLLLPMLEQLSAIYPDATIEVLAERRNAEVFSWSPAVSTVWCYDKPLGFIKLFQRHYDLIIDTEQWYRLSAVVARLLAAPRLAGFATNTRSRLFTDPCPYPLDTYEATVFMGLLAPFHNEKFASTSEIAQVLVLPATDYRIEGRYIVISTGASVPAKHWPAERYAEVACYCEKKGFVVVVLGGADDCVAGTVVASAINHCHNLAGKTTLTEAAALIAGAALMISGDTGLLHVAQVQEVLTVALFGPSDPVKWCRKNVRHRVVSAGVECSPCSRFGTIPKCPHGFQCMQNITVDMVIKAVSTVLEENVPERVG